MGSLARGTRHEAHGTPARARQSEGGGAGQQRQGWVGFGALEKSNERRDQDCAKSDERQSGIRMMGQQEKKGLAKEKIDR